MPKLIRQTVTGPLEDARSKNVIVVKHPTDSVDELMVKPDQESVSAADALRTSEGGSVVSLLSGASWDTPWASAA